MTAATNLVQTEVPAPAYKVIADQVQAILAAGQGHDQETIRVALNTFSQACRATPETICEGPRRY